MFLRGKTFNGHSPKIDFSWHENRIYNKSQCSKKKGTLNFLKRLNFVVVETTTTFLITQNNILNVYGGNRVFLY